MQFSKGAQSANSFFAAAGNLVGRMSNVDRLSSPVTKQNSTGGRRPNPHGVARPTQLFEFVLQAPEKIQQQRNGVPYCTSMHLDDATETVVPWGSIVIGEPLNDAWLQCGKVFFPRKIDGDSVCEPRQFSLETVQLPKVKMPKPPGWMPFGWQGDVSEESDSEEEEEAEDEMGGMRSDAQHPMGSVAPSHGSVVPPGIARLGSGATEDSDETSWVDRRSTRRLSSGAAASAVRRIASTASAASSSAAAAGAVAVLSSGSSAAKSVHFGGLLSGTLPASAKMPLLSFVEVAQRLVEAPPILVDNEKADADPEADDEPIFVERMPIEARLPALEATYWAAPGGLSAPHLDPVRCCPDDLQEAALRGDVALVRKYIAAGVPVNSPMRSLNSDEFVTLVHMLASRTPALPNRQRVLVELLRSKADPDVRSSLGATPLIVACLRKNVGAVQVLLHFGASAWPVDDKGRTAVRCAIIPDPTLPQSENLSVELAELLGAAGAPLDEGGSVPPIVEAVMQHNGAAVKALIRLRAMPDGLNEAVLNAPVSIITDLIEAEANPFHRDSTSRTVMEIALGRGEDCITTMLRDYIGDLERGGHPHLKTREKDGMQVNTDLNVDSKKIATYENFTYERQRKGQRASLASRIAEDAMSQQRPMTPLRWLSYRAQIWCRRACRSYSFQTIMLIFLFLALFLPDLWVIANMADAGPLDAMIVVIFLGFLVEWVFQIVGMRWAYICKFNFWMDILGCWTVPLDHSLVTQSIISSFSSVDSSTLARITKLVKLGARAGRLSRLVKLLRFLPGMGDKGGQSLGTASAMSKTINMRISLQVSAIIIMMVVILPLLDVARYPQHDYSIMMWTRMVGRAALSYPEDLEAVISEMTVFFSTMNYRPYQLTCRLANGTMQTIDIAAPPVRKQDIFDVEAAEVTTSLKFDFRGPNLVEAVCNCILIILIVLVMFTSALLVSFAVNSVVLNPLDKLLSIVKEVASKIFFSVQDLSKATGADEKDKRKNNFDMVDEDSDREEGNEAKTLERVLKKLEKLSELTAKKTPAEEAYALSQDVRDLLLDYSPPLAPPIDVELVAKGMLAQQLSEAQQDAEMQDHIRAVFEESNINWDSFNSWPCDVTVMPGNQLEILAASLMKWYKMPDPPKGDTVTAMNSIGNCTPQCSLLREPPSPAEASDMEVSPTTPSKRASLSTRRRSNVGRRKSEIFLEEDWNAMLGDFITAISDGYADAALVPYHNFVHAVDVAVTLHHTLGRVNAVMFLKREERLGLIAAALAHDIGHTGSTNDFLIYSCDDVARLYNDRSPLEAMHCARLFEIITKPGTAIFGHTHSSLYRAVRRVCVEAILCTDNQFHFNLVRELETLYDMKHDVCDAMMALEGSDNESEAPEPGLDFVEFVVGKPENVKLFLKVLLRFADHSNSMKSFAQSQLWATKMFEEFLLQGDRERELGMPIHVWHDRDKLNLPLAQVQILELCVAPLACAASCLMPGLVMPLSYLRDNAMQWVDLWVEESNPDKADLAKVSEGVSKIRRERPKPKK